MKYFIYENWTASKVARIHKATCRFCNNGEGIRVNILGNRNGQWHGPFRTYNEANNYNGLIRVTTKVDCLKCN